MPAERVFVSRPAALTSAQQALDSAWSGGITGLGFIRTGVIRSEYDAPPWQQLRAAVRDAHGVVVLGFRQLLVKSGWQRPGTPEARPAAGWYASPWNHLEAGLAIMAELPVLVAVEAPVSGGLFSSHVWGDHVYGVDIGVWSRGVDAAAESSIAAWSRAVRAEAFARGNRGDSVTL